MNRTLGAFAVAVTVAGINMAVAQSAGLMNQKFPDVIDVRVHARSDSRFDFDATISSPYDTPQRYAYVFRVMSVKAFNSVSAPCFTTMRTSNLSPVIYTEWPFQPGSTP